MDRAAAKIRVRGMVQGVGFRYFCYRRAGELDLNGWVVNMPDRSVSLLVEGDKAAIEGMIEQLKIGPGGAAVSEVDVEWQEFSGQYITFDIRH